MAVKMRVVQGRPAGKILVFSDGVYYIGRGAECHIRPNSEWVSRQHCVLRVVGYAVTIRDLGSRNGTLVNGTLVEREQKLEDGDEIQVGPLVFELRVEDSTTGRPPAPTKPVALDETRPAEGKDQANEYGSTAELPIFPPPED
jgi:pSer/pThr/pTyr-binding forkhead associated (FHA) protein